MPDFTQEDIMRMATGGVVSPETPVRRMVIHQPEVLTRGDKAVLRSLVELGDVGKVVEFSTDAEFGQYLCYERSDAFLIGFLNLAMRERCDIYCEAPVTTELMHQLRTELVPTICKYDHALYHTQIHAETSDEALPCAGKIGTGCSCGIDSFYAIQSLSNDPDFKLDYVTLNNVGAYETWGGRYSRQHYQEDAENAKAFATEYGYKLIVTDSNFAESFPQHHLFTHLYSSSFAIYALRKLWKRYYYASTGCDLQSYFMLEDNHKSDSAHYDLIALPAFSIPSLRICNQGIGVSRFEKTKALSDYIPARRYLNVCIVCGNGGCGKCAKCLRTMWILDALGKLDNFKEVFDVNAYRANYSRNMMLLYFYHRIGVPMLSETYKILKGRIALWMMVPGELWYQLRKIPFIHSLGRRLKRKMKG